MSGKRKARMTRTISVATFTASLLFAGSGCARLCGSGSRSTRADNPAAHNTDLPTSPAKATVAEAGQPALAPADPANDFGNEMTGQPTHDAVLTAAEPRWANETKRANHARTVNVFGEMDGVPRGPFKAVGEAGFQQHTSVDEGEDGDVAIDPTGKWLVFSSTRHNEAGDIYLQRVDGTSVTQLTNDVARDAYPTFSPDGKWIAFSSTRAGNWQIYRTDLDGRNVVQVTSGPMQAIHPSFSPDGNRLVYSALGARSQQWELWTVDLLSGERRQVGYGLFPSWSPDKTTDRIAYQRARQRGSRWFSLWTMDLVNGEGRRMTEVAVSSNAAIVAPCWSPDGKRLAFTTVVQPAEGEQPGQQDVWTVDSDGGNKRRLTDGNGTNLMPAWATDNRVYFVSNRGGNEGIWSVQAGPADTFTAEAPHMMHSPAEASVDTSEVTH